MTSRLVSRRLTEDEALAGEPGFRVVDVWESEEAVQRFGENLTPILKTRKPAPEAGFQGDCAGRST
jgi:hypothetical protein